jgi:hypothetical protein
MRKKTTLSVVGLSRRANLANPGTHPTALTRRILIANPRLKFNLSYRKESLLKISNRERIAIFRLATEGNGFRTFCGPIPPRTHSLTGRKEIAAGKREGPGAHYGLAATHESQVTNHKSLLLIGNPAIKIPSNTMKKSYLAISNRQ